jgi:type VI secretion system protein ImpK
MKLEEHQHAGITTIDTDLILQNTYLLVIELRMGSRASGSKTLREDCIAQVEDVRSALQKAGMSARSVDLISHAQCALLDEAVLATTRDGVRHAWTHETLQTRFLGHHRAGEMLFEEMRQALREPAPNLHVLTVYDRVMMLGFLGAYRALEDADRLSLMRQLRERIPPLPQAQALPSSLTGMKEPSQRYRRWLRSPAVHLVACSLFLALVWWLLDRSLANAIASLTLGGV